MEEGEAPLTVGRCPRFLAAADKFVVENSGFESSAVGEAARRDLEKATSLYQASLVPLRHKVFGFETALKWGFFVHTAGGRFFGEEAEDLLPAFQDPALWPPFDAGRFFGELASIYDLAVESSVWEHCNSDSDSDSDDDDDEDDEDDAAAEEPAEDPRERRRAREAPEDSRGRRRDRGAPRPRSG
ncbi:MAG: hypothetical protein QF593_04855 [Nitrospinota bacterium]|nr:hypothetical protein [Nitrospinota bacterium]